MNNIIKSLIVFMMVFTHITSYSQNEDEIVRASFIAAQRASMNMIKERDLEKQRKHIVDEYERKMMFYSNIASKKATFNTSKVKF